MVAEGLVAEDYKETRNHVELMCFLQSCGSKCELILTKSLLLNNL